MRGLEAVIGSLLVRLNAETVQFERQMQDAAALAEASSARAQQAATRMAVASAAAFSAFATSSVAAFSRFDDAITKSTSIMVDITDDLRERMVLTARQISRDTVTSANAAAESFYFLAAAGLSTEQSIAALPLVNAFAIAGNFDMALATDLLTDAQSALGLAVNDTAQNYANMLRLSDVLVKANTLANSSVSLFSEALTNKAAAALRNVNIEVEEGVAVLAAFADQGLKGRGAGEALNILLRDLQRAAIGNREAFRQFNIEVFDAGGNLNNLADIIGQMEASLMDASPEMRRIQLEMLGFQDRSVSAMLTLMGTSEKIREYEAALRDAGGMTQAVAENQMGSFLGRLSILRNRVVDFSIVVGGMIAEALGPFVSVLTQLIGVLGNLNPRLIQIGLIAGGTLTAIVALAGAIKALAFVKLALVGTLVTLKLAFVAFAASPLLLTVAGIGMVATALIALWAQTEEGSRQVTHLKDSFLTLWDALQTGHGVTSTIAAIGYRLMAAAASFGGQILDALVETGSLASAIFRGVFSAVADRFGARLSSIIASTVATMHSALVQVARFDPTTSEERFHEISRRQQQLEMEAFKARQAAAKNAEKEFDVIARVNEEIASLKPSQFAEEFSRYWHQRAEAAIDSARAQIQAEKDAQASAQASVQSGRDRVREIEQNAARLLEIQQEMDQFILGQRSPFELSIERIGKLNELIAAGVPEAEKYAEARDRILQEMGMHQQNEFFSGFGVPAAEDPFSRFAREQEALTEHYRRQRQIVEENETLLGETKNEILSRMEDEYNQKMQQYQIARQALILNSTKELFSGLADLAKTFAGEQSGIFKALFAASKAFAIAEAVVKIQQGLANAAAMPFPSNLAAMGTVVAATSGIVSTIQGTQMRSFLGGGFTGTGNRQGGVDGRGGFPAILHPNEQVIDLKRNPGLDKPVTITINNMVGGEAEVRETENSDHRFIEVFIRKVKKEIASDFRQGGNDITKAVETAYNLRRGRTG